MRISTRRNTPQAQLPELVVAKVIEHLDAVSAVRAGAVSREWRTASAPRIEKFKDISKNLNLRKTNCPRQNFEYPMPLAVMGFIVGGVLASAINDRCLKVPFALACISCLCGGTVGAGADLVTYPIRAAMAMHEARQQYKDKLADLRVRDEKYFQRALKNS